MTTRKQGSKIPQKETTKPQTKSSTDLSQVEQSVAAKIAELEQLKKDLEERAKVLYGNKPKEAKEDKKDFNPLYKKLIVIEPVRKQGTAAVKDENEASMLTGTSRSYVVQTDSSGRIINPLTKQEQEFFEKLLGIDLNPFNAYDKNFWVTKKSRLQIFKVGRAIKSATVTLDLSNPYDYILYKVALAHDKIANSIIDLNNNPLYELVIVDDEEVFAEELSETKREDYVFEYLLRHRNNKKVLYDLLRLHGLSTLKGSVTLDTSTEKLYVLARKVARDPESIEKLYNIIELEESVRATKILIEDAIMAGFIKVYANEYSLNGGQVIGHSKEEVERFFSSPKNNTLKLQLNEKVEAFLQTKF